jgi:hypothetical protein
MKKTLDLLSCNGKKELKTAKNEWIWIAKVTILLILALEEAAKAIQEHAPLSGSFIVMV